MAEATKKPTAVQIVSIEYDAEAKKSRFKCVLVLLWLVWNWTLKYSLRFGAFVWPRNWEVCFVETATEISGGLIWKSVWPISFFCSLDEDALGSILLSAGNKDLPVVVVSIAGASASNFWCFFSGDVCVVADLPAEAVATWHPQSRWVSPDFTMEKNGLHVASRAPRGGRCEPLRLWEAKLQISSILCCLPIAFFFTAVEHNEYTRLS
jgi:hypothetical protein